MSRSLLLLLLLLSFFLSLLISTTAHGGSDDGDTPTSDMNNDHQNLQVKPLILFKIWCLILVFVGTFIGGVSPYFLKWNEGFLVFETQFAGGVFLGTALMHLLSDANETFEDYLTSVEYPFPFMSACAGFLLTMLADCVVSYVYGKKKDVSNGDLDHQGGVEQRKSSQNGTTTHSHFQAHNGTDAHSANSSLATAGSLGDIILLIIALCFHYVFEGIAEIKDGAWKALWTISLHNTFATIAMGIALLRMMPHRPLLSCTAYAFAFAISNPIGVAIGIAIDVTTRGPVADCIFAISMGIAYILREK